MSSDQVKNENPGVVTSDSLAAESINGGGAFGAGSDSRGPNLQPSRSTTTNTTDVSNATELPPAADAHARLVNEPFDPNAELDEGRGAGKEAGRGPTWNVPSTGTQEAVSDVANPAQPKGKNFHEGDFDHTAPNASFTTNIGSKGDPGRVALEKMETRTASAAGGFGPVQDQITNDGQYDALHETNA